MSALPLSLDRTDLDFDAIRARLFALIHSVFPTWTDENVADFGTILLEAFAWVGDVLMYYLEAYGRESRITTATQRRSLLALAKLVGFAVPGASAATVDVTFSLPAATPGEVPLPKGTRILTEDVIDPTAYQLLFATAIPAGSTSLVVSVEQSEYRVEVFDASGLANQEAALATTPYLDDSAVVVASNGVFTQVANFLSSTSADRHYTVVVDQNDRALLRFGNGINGALPTGTIEVEYKVGGGAKGRVDANTLKRLETSFTDSLGNPVLLTVTNAAKSSGGSDRMSIEAIRLRAPASIRAPLTCVAREDFEINAKRLASVARALMLTRNEDPSIAENAGVLYVVPSGGGLPSLALKAQVLTQCTVTYPCTLTFELATADPLYKTVNVRAIVFFRQGAVRATVKKAVQDALTAFFALDLADGSENHNVDFGANLKNEAGVIEATLALSDLQNVVRDTPGIRKLAADSSGFLLNNAHVDVPLLRAQFPVFGTLVLIDGETGLQVLWPSRSPTWASKRACRAPRGSPPAGPSRGRRAPSPLSFSTTRRAPTATPRASKAAGSTMATRSRSSQPTS